MTTRSESLPWREYRDATADCPITRRAWREALREMRERRAESRRAVRRRRLADKLAFLHSGQEAC